MAHFAKVVNGIVEEVLVVEQEFINSGALGDPSMWIQTSYNTRGNVHYGQDGAPDGGIALRGNYAGLGYTYDAVNDVFIPPPTFPSWVINTTTWTWDPPFPPPPDNDQGPYKPAKYEWNEEQQNWVEVPMDDLQQVVGAIKF